MANPRHEGMANNLRLLLDAIAREWPPGFISVIIAAKWMAHQWQIETAFHLRLPDMDHLMNEQTFQI